jgi:multiple sugar transport system ATP-binding protein
MASITYEHVYKYYAGSKTAAISDLTLFVEDKEFLVLVGPSGCGKSTALRMLAGLEEISQGTIRIGERVVNDIAPKDRDIAMVFQSYALYPHMSVYDNMAFSLRMRGTPKGEMDRRVQEAAQILGIEQFLDRKPRALSGGQRQRVALGRAIVREPKVFLMDEPLSNLDAKLRVATRAELTKLHQRLQTTFVYVTHDQVEAMTMGMRIAVLKDGLLQQLDTPQNLYRQPGNKFVAGFIGSPAMNFFDGRLVGEDGRMYVDMGNFRVPIPEDKAAALQQKGVPAEVVFGIRPEDIHDKLFLPKGVVPEAEVSVQVDVVERLGAELFVYMISGPHNFLARVDNRTQCRPGDTMQAVMNMAYMHVFDRTTEVAYL